MGSSRPRDGSAGAVVVGAIERHAERLRDLEAGVRADQPDAVHTMRVATRRLRSILAVYGRLFDRSATEPVRDELQWLGQLLGAARDAEVLRKRLGGLVAELPTDLVIGPVATRIDHELAERHDEALRRVAHAFDGARYRRLERALRELVRHPPVRGRARKRAAKVLPRSVAEAEHRLRKRERRAERMAPDDPRRDATVHDVRKAAKRVRYAAEVARPVQGKPAKRLVKAMRRCQDELGARQDGVEARRVLREIAIAAHLAGENGFTYGVLHEAEAARTTG